MDENSSYPTSYLDDDACIGNKGARQYGGLVNLEWMTNQKAREPLDKGRLCMTCKCWCRHQVWLRAIHYLFKVKLKAIFKILVF
jgi:hypothetical protein